MHTICNADDCTKPVIQNSYVTITPIILGADSVPESSAAAESTRSAAPEAVSPGPKRPLHQGNGGAEAPDTSLPKRQKTQECGTADATTSDRETSEARRTKAVAFVCHLADRPGKFLPAKAAALGAGSWALLHLKCVLIVLVRHAMLGLHCLPTMMQLMLIHSPCMHSAHPANEISW